MRITLRSLTGCAGLGLALGILSGCQTYMGGLTLPSGQYLKQRPQYFPPDPVFPLQREVDASQDPDGLLRRNAGAAGAPIVAPFQPVGSPAPALGPPK